MSPDRAKSRATVALEDSRDADVLSDASKSERLVNENRLDHDIRSEDYDISSKHHGHDIPVGTLPKKKDDNNKGKKSHHREKDMDSCFDPKHDVRHNDRDIGGENSSYPQSNTIDKINSQEQQSMLQHQEEQGQQGQQHQRISASPPPLSGGVLREAGDSRRPSASSLKRKRRDNEAQQPSSFLDLLRRRRRHNDYESNNSKKKTTKKREENKDHDLHRRESGTSSDLNKKGIGSLLAAADSHSTSSSSSLSAGSAAAAEEGDGEALSSSDDDQEEEDGHSSPKPQKSHDPTAPLSPSRAAKAVRDFLDDDEKGSSSWTAESLAAVVNLPAFVKEHETLLTFPEMLYLILTHLENEARNKECHNGRKEEQEDTGALAHEREEPRQGGRGRGMENTSVTVESRGQEEERNELVTPHEYGKKVTICLPCLSWTHGGKSIAINDAHDMVMNVFPHFFVRDLKIESFVRKLYRWGFRRIQCTPALPVTDTTPPVAGGRTSSPVLGGEQHQQRVSLANENKQGRKGASRHPLPQQHVSSGGMIFTHDHFCKENRALMEKMRSVTAETIRRKEAAEIAKRARNPTSSNIGASMVQCFQGTKRPSVSSPTTSKTRVAAHRNHLREQEDHDDIAFGRRERKETVEVESASSFFPPNAKRARSNIAGGTSSARSVGLPPLPSAPALYRRTSSSSHSTVQEQPDDQRHSQLLARIAAASDPTQTRGDVTSHIMDPIAAAVATAASTTRGLIGSSSGNARSPPQGSQNPLLVQTEPQYRREDLLLRRLLALQGEEKMATTRQEDKEEMIIQQAMAAARRGDHGDDLLLQRLLLQQRMRQTTRSSSHENNSVVSPPVPPLEAGNETRRLLEQDGGIGRSLMMAGPAPALSPTTSSLRTPLPIDHDPLLRLDPLLREQQYLRGAAAIAAATDHGANARGPSSLLLPQRRAGGGGLEDATLEAAAAAIIDDHHRGAALSSALGRNQVSASPASSLALLLDNPRARTMLDSNRSMMMQPSSLLAAAGGQSLLTAQQRQLLVQQQLLGGGGYRDSDMALLGGDIAPPLTPRSSSMLVEQRSYRDVAAPAAFGVTSPSEVLRQHAEQLRGMVAAPTGGGVALSRTTSLLRQRQHQQSGVLLAGGAAGNNPSELVQSLLLQQRQQQQQHEHEQLLLGSLQLQRHSSGGNTDRRQHR